MATNQELAKIVNRIRSGDRAAFSDLYEATYKSVFYHAQTILKNNEDVEDAVQEAYEQAYMNLDRLKSPEAVASWLNQIVSNISLNKVRGSKSRKETFSLDDEDFTFEPVALDADTPDRVLDQKGTEEIIGSFINALPYEQKTTVILYYYDEMSVGDIARAMGCSTGTVKSRLNYARKSIEKAVREEEKRGVKLYSAMSPALLAASIDRLANTSHVPASAGSVARSLAAEYGYDAGRWSLSSASKTVSASASAAAGAPAAVEVEAAAAVKPTVEATAAGAKAKSAVFLRILAVIAAVGIGLAVYFSYAPDPDAEETVPEEEVVYNVEIEEPEEVIPEEEQEEEEEPEIETPEDVITEEEAENELNPEADENAESEMAATPEEKTYYTGDLLDFGNYEQDANLENGPEPITWQVLDVQDGKAFLISQYALDTVPFSMYTDRYPWELSDMRNFLNDDFLMGSFTREERKAILMTSVDNGTSQAPRTASGGGPDTEDKIYLMSYAEAQKYFADDDSRICIPTAYAISQGVVPDITRGSCIWRLRMGGSVNTSGAIVTSGINIQAYNVTLRPCMWVDLSAGPFSGEKDVEDENVTDFTVGEYTTFGRYEQDNNPENGPEAIDWLVLDIQGDIAVMISQYGLDCIQFHNSYAGISWEDSDLRSWLNDQFYSECFSIDEKAAVLDTEVDNSKAQNDANILSADENTTTDKVFLLSYKEADTLFPYSYKRICMPTAYAASKTLKLDPKSGSCMWWLRTPGTSAYNREIVTANGELNGFGKSVNWNISSKPDGEIGVRPVIRVDMTAKIFTGE